MTENAILADEDFIKKEFDLKEYKYDSEGKNGKHIISELLRNKNISYKETFHGVEFLKKIRLSNSAINSPSVNNFVSNLNIPCWWF